MRRFLSLLLLGAAPLAAQDTGWTITDFAVAYVVNPSRTIDVTETIVVDFGTLRRHGIYREIPIKYRREVDLGIPVGAGTVAVDLQDIRVTDADGRPLGLQVTRGNVANLRIGDADSYVTGIQTYVISYRLERGLGFFDDHDELYWQVTGTEWPVPILRASATVTLPTASSSGEGLGAWCYAGHYDSSDQGRCSAEAGANGTYRFATGRLLPGEGLTLVAAFPKGIIAPPTWLDAMVEKLALLWPLGVPFMVFAFMHWRWRKVGRDPGRRSVVPNWKVPRDLPAGLAGTLFDQSADMDDVVAVILGLAVMGYIKISEVPPRTVFGEVDEESFFGKLLTTLGVAKVDWELERLRQGNEGELAAHEQLVIHAIFGLGTTKRMSDLHNEFYKEIPEIKSALYDEVVSRGLYARNPNSARTRYLLLGVLVLVIGIGIGGVLQSPLMIGAAVASAVVVFAFAPFMPARTLKGANQWEQLRGLEEYIRRAEKLELEMRQAPEKTTELFETMLPYAVALNVSDLWVKEFETVLAAEPPTWYVGSQPGRFNVSSFSHGLSSFQTAATRTLGSSPGSSSGSGGGGGGGGSVGGGGGGGGGGSW
jgi:hypothetical protein